jgi:hypothetical protein
MLYSLINDPFHPPGTHGDDGRLEWLLLRARINYVVLLNGSSQLGCSDAAGTVQKHKMTPSVIHGPLNGQQTKLSLEKQVLNFLP